MNYTPIRSRPNIPRRVRNIVIPSLIAIGTLAVSFAARADNSELEAMTQNTPHYAVEQQCAPGYIAIAEDGVTYTKSIDQHCNMSYKATIPIGGNQTHTISFADNAKPTIFGDDDIFAKYNENSRIIREK